METLKTIKNRIRTVDSIIKATKAMKMVATVKLSKINSVNSMSKQCAEALFDVLSKAINEARFKQIIDHDSWLSDRCGKKLLIILSMDQGFCGAFNQSIIDRSKHAVSELNPDYIEVFGKKAKHIENSINKIKTNRTITSRTDIGEFSEVLSMLTFEYIKDFEVSEVHVVSGEFKNVLVQKARLLNVFPMAIDSSKETEFTEIEGDKLEFIESAFKIYLSKLYKGLVTEHLVSEYSARVMAMDNSVRNANDMFEKLNALYNRIRQGKITQELTEIVSSVECVQ